MKLLVSTKKVRRLINSSLKDNRFNQCGQIRLSSVDYLNKKQELGQTYIYTKKSESKK